MAGNIKGAVIAKAHGFMTAIDTMDAGARSVAHQATAVVNARSAIASLSGRAFRSRASCFFSRVSSDVS